MVIDYDGRILDVFKVGFSVGLGYIFVYFLRE